MTHDHEDGFEAGCGPCELNEVSLQDTGRPWAARAIKHFADSPLPGQREAGAA